MGVSHGLTNKSAAGRRYISDFGTIYFYYFAGANVSLRIVFDVLDYLIHYRLSFLHFILKEQKNNIDETVFFTKDWFY